MTARRLPGTATLAALSLLLVTLVWGSTFVVIKDAVTRMPATDFLAVRFLIAAAVMLVIAPRSVGSLSSDDRRKGVVLGVLYGGGQVLQTLGLAHTSASVSGFLTGLYVVLTPLFAGALLRQRVPALAWVATLLSTAGLALLSLHGAALGGGELMTIACAAVYALHILALGAWATPGTAIGLSTLQVLVVAVLCTLAALPHGVTVPPDAQAWWAVVYTAVAAGAVAVLVQTWAQAHMTATRAAVTMTMEPVFASAFAVGVGGERLTTRLLVGGALVVTAMLVVEAGPRHGAEATVPHPTAS